jgi:imidazolonepropionase-like amidohydrolase
MRMRVVGVSCVAMLLTLLAADGRTQQDGRAVLFEGARLIVGDGGTIERAAFVVQNGRFTQVGRQGAITAPRGAARIDLTGKTVTPGLIDVHTHLGYEGYTSWAAEHYSRANIIDHLDRYAYYGVGAIMSIGTDPTALAQEIEREQRAGKIGGAKVLFCAGAGPPGGGPNEDLRKLLTSGGAQQAGYALANEAEARKTVSQLADRGVNCIKLWVDDRGGTQPKLQPAVYRAAIDEAHKRGMKVLAHPQNADDMRELVRAGIDRFLHLRVGVDDETVRLMKQRNIPVSPGLGLPEMRRRRVFEEPFLADTVPPQVTKRLADQYAKRNAAPPNAAAAERDRALKDTFKKLLAADVWILPGSDSGGLPDHFFGWAVHKEMEVFVEWGMTPAAAMVAATSRSAATLGLKDYGTVATGKVADFLILDANPLDDIRNTQRISQVYLRGQQVDRAAMRARWNHESTKGTK